MTEELKNYIENSPIVKAAITEAVHRYYYDRILSTKPEDIKALKDNNVSYEYSVLWNETPNFRYILVQAASRYKNPPNTDVVSVFGKPKNNVR